MNGLFLFSALSLIAYGVSGMLILRADKQRKPADNARAVLVCSTLTTVASLVLMQMFHP